MSKTFFLSFLIFLCLAGGPLPGLRGFAQVLAPSTLAPPVPIEESEEASEAAIEDTFDLLQNRAGGITIVRYKGEEKNVVIPERIGGLPVTIIGNKAFYRMALSSVVIPETVIAIEPLAFAENNLQSVVMAGCVSIAYEAFAGNQLSSVVFSERIVSIGPRAFINNKLSSITVPGAVTNIGKDAFAGNPLVSITAARNRNLFAGQGFDLSFVNYYIGMGRRAGVYIKDGKIWSLRE